MFQFHKQQGNANQELRAHYDRLHSHSSIPQGVALQSESGAYYAILRDDGSLYVYVSNHFVNQNIIYSTQSSNQGQGPYQLRMQEDGNLVIYDRHEKPTWASNTHKKGSGPYRLVIQNDGNLVLYDSHNNAHWASNTNR